MAEELEKIMAELKSADARHRLSLIAAAEKEIDEYRWHFSLTARSDRVTALNYPHRNTPDFESYVECLELSGTGMCNRILLDFQPSACEFDNRGSF